MQAARACPHDLHLQPADAARIEGEPGADRAAAALRRDQEQPAPAQVEHPPEAPIADPHREIDRIAVMHPPVADLRLAQGRDGPPGESPGKAGETGPGGAGGLHAPCRLVGGGGRGRGVPDEVAGGFGEILRRVGEAPGGRRLRLGRRRGGGEGRAQAGERGRQSSHRHRPGAGEAAAQGPHLLHRPGGIGRQKLEFLRRLPERRAADPGAGGLDRGVEGEAVGLPRQGRHRLDDAGGILRGAHHLGLEHAALGIGALEVAAGLDQHPGEPLGLGRQGLGGGAERPAARAGLVGPDAQIVERAGEGEGVGRRRPGLGAAVPGGDPDGAGRPDQLGLDPVDGVAPGPPRHALRPVDRRRRCGERRQDLDRVGAVAGRVGRAEAQTHGRDHSASHLKAG